MPDPALKNIALLIDADNASHAGIDPVLTVLAELGQVNIRRAYGNWAKPALSNWNKITHRFGIQPMQQFDLTKGKNATDIAMAIDAIDLLNAGKVDGFGIMSSDSDFTPLVTRLRQDGMIVYGFGSSDKAPDAFKSVCTRFIDVDALIATADSDVEVPQAAPKATGTKTPIDEEVIDLLGSGMEGSKARRAGLCEPCRKSARSPTTAPASMSAITASHACRI